MLRRHFVWGSLAFGSLSLSDPILAQGVCKNDGPSGDEILADILDRAPSRKPKYKYFDIEIRRDQVAQFQGKDKSGKDREEDGVIGTIFLNGRQIGHAVENDKLKIPAGEYPGYMRYVSGKNFVQGPFGTMAGVGDFLLEAGKVPGRTHILFHGGTKPWHSEGCILLGAVKSEKDANGKIKKSWVEQGSALATLRREFYGTETPAACPNTSVIIKII